MCVFGAHSINYFCIYIFLCLKNILMYLGQLFLKCEKYVRNKQLFFLWTLYGSGGSVCLTTSNHTYHLPIIQLINKLYKILKIICFKNWWNMLNFSTRPHNYSIFFMHKMCTITIRTWSFRRRKRDPKPTENYFQNYRKNRLLNLTP